MAAPLLVHETHRPPAPVLRYVDQVAGTQPDISFRYSQGVLTSFDVDIVHVAEPYMDVLLGTRGAGSYQRLLAGLALSRNLRRHRIALVRTLPVAAAPLRGADRIARRILDRATSRFVVFDESTPSPDPTKTTVISHSHYRDRFVGYPRGHKVPGRMLCIAAEALPDEAEGLLAVARVVNTAGVTLRIAGVASAALDGPLRTARALHSAIVSTRLELLSDGAQVQEIDAAELVVVPQIESLATLQLVFLALSLDRPVLARRTEALAALAGAVGPGWLHLSDGPITAEAVDRAYTSLRQERTERPCLDGRDLVTTQGAYAAVFRGAASRGV